MFGICLQLSPPNKSPENLETLASPLYISKLDVRLACVPKCSHVLRSYLSAFSNCLCARTLVYRFRVLLNCTPGHIAITLF